MKASSGRSEWRRVPIARIEDLEDAVLGAGLEATQMSRAPVTGSLAFAAVDGIHCSTGYVGGRVALKGPLSETLITLGLGVALIPGTRHWLNEVSSGEIGVFLPGEEHDALYMPGSIYASVSVSPELLANLSARLGIVLDPSDLACSGVADRAIGGRELLHFQRQFCALHTGAHERSSNPNALGRALLYALIAQLGREPRTPVGGTDPRGHARIVARARSFIHENLDQPISIEAIAAHARTSHRTLHRAFQSVLDETPYSYVRKLRLHRIRYELISHAEKVTTVSSVANGWGMRELGRFAGWYRNHFGELPSQTLASGVAKVTIR